MLTPRGAMLWTRVESEYPRHDALEVLRYRDFAFPTAICSLGVVVDLHVCGKGRQQVAIDKGAREEISGARRPSRLGQRNQSDSVDELARPEDGGGIRHCKNPRTLSSERFAIALHIIMVLQSYNPQFHRPSPLKNLTHRPRKAPI
jgi:hypothetical protein